MESGMIGAADWKRTEDEIKIRKVDVADVLGRDQDHVREIEKGAGSAAAETEGKIQIVLGDLTPCEFRL